MSQLKYFISPLQVFFKYKNNVFISVTIEKIKNEEICKRMNVMD